MTSNTNTHTGYRYGIIDARNCMALWEDIITNGVNESYTVVERELRTAIKTVLDNKQTTLLNFVDELTLAVDLYSHQAIACVEELALYANTSIQDAKDDIDIDQLIENVLEDWECDEMEYSYQDETGIYLQQHLGGMPIIFVVESSWLIRTADCFPCLPNGGDLDEPCLYGEYTYSIPPDAYEDDRLRAFVRTNYRQFSRLQSWVIADVLACHFTGDANCIDHNGTFYETANWDRYGYADCVRFLRLCDDGEDRLIVSCETINKEDDTDSVLSSSGWKLRQDEYGQDEIYCPHDGSIVATGDSVKHCIIDATMSHWGTELEDFSGRYEKVFSAEQCDNEDEIWDSVRGWLNSLNERRSS